MQIILLFNFCIGFIFSIVLLYYYTGGDQEFYINYYEDISNTNFIEAIIMGKSYLSSSEYFTLSLYWLGSYLKFDKIFYMSAFNGLLQTLYYLVYKKYKTSFIFYLFLSLNFYTIVLFTGAERLKFLYIFMIIIFLIKNKFISTCLTFITPLLHLQSGLFYIPIFILKFTKYIFNYKKNIINIIIIIISSIILYKFLDIGIIIKKILLHTSRNDNYSGLIKFLVLFTYLILIFPKLKSFYLISFSLLPFVLMFGADRILMVYITLICYLLVSRNKTSSFKMIPLYSYFVIKSFPFIFNIITFGNGFHIS